MHSKSQSSFSTVKTEKTYLTNSPKQTRKLGEKLAKKIILNGPALQKAVVLGLKGDLGGGKTTFLQGFAKGLGVLQKILSPTFIIMKRFLLKKNKTGFKNFYHLDCYRIKNPKEIFTLGFKEIIKDPENIVAIEWSERISKALPKNHLRINFQFINDKKRKVTINK